MCQIATGSKTGQAKQGAACNPPPEEQQPPTGETLCQIATERLQESDPARALPPNWEGFRFNDRGELTTRSGYRCSPQSLEAALWLLGCWSSESRQYLIRSDEARSAVRPLYETSDADDSGKTKATRLRLIEEQERFCGDETGDQASTNLDAHSNERSEPVTRSKAQTSAAIEPPLQRLRRATARQILITPSAGEDDSLGARSPSPALGAFQRL